MAKSNSISTLTVRILGRDYPISCPDHEREALLLSAEYLSDRMQSIRTRNKTLALDRVAVIAALNTARELLSLEQELKSLQDQAQAAPAPLTDHADGNQSQDLLARLSELQSRVNKVLHTHKTDK